jgi:hypothetical protein
MEKYVHLSGLIRVHLSIVIIYYLCHLLMEIDGRVWVHFRMYPSIPTYSIFTGRQVQVGGGTRER